MKYPYRFEKPEYEGKLNAKQKRPIDKNKFLIKWERVLEECDNELEVQRFIENYPFVLPGLWDYHHGPIWSVIISQFPLGADFVPDFVFLTSNSGILQYTFVEIENPKKPIFNKDDSISAKFQQGLQQVRDWYMWTQKNLSSLENKFSDLLEGERYPFPHSKFYYVCGRRSEVYETPKRRERWEGFVASLGRDFVVMTYDRLTDAIRNLPTPVIYDRYVVCTYKDKSFIVKPTSIDDTMPADLSRVKQE